MLKALERKHEDFKQIRKLGQGTFGTVSLYHDAMTGKNVAIKWLVEENSSLKELDMMIQYTYPSVIQILGVILPRDSDGQGHIGIVMPYMPRSLHDVVSARFRDEEVPGWTNTKKMIVLLGVAAALMHVHAKQGAHRDIKPANVLLNDDFEPFLADFGLATLDIQRTITTCAGTPIFMAPEMIEGEGRSEKVDIYSFGVLAYMVICEKDVWRGKKSFFVYNEVTNGGRPPIPSNISPAAKHLITQCWDHLPGNRPSARAIVDFLMKEKVLDNVASYEFVPYILKTVGQDLPPETLTISTQRSRKPNQLTEFDMRNQAMCGDVNMQVALGIRYLKGDGVEVNMNEGRKFLRMALNFNAQAGLELGKTYLDSDPKEAAVCLQKAADLGSQEAKALLERLKAKGVTSEARSTVTRSDPGLCDPHEAFKNAREVFNPNRDCPDNKHARAVFEIALNSGITDARYYLGLACEKGLGGPKDVDRAMQLYSQGDADGCLMCTTRLGDVYLEGVLFKKDFAKATQYYQKAARQNYKPAMTKLGQLRALAAVARFG